MPSRARLQGHSFLLETQALRIWPEAAFAHFNAWLSDQSVRFGGIRRAFLTVTILLYNSRHWEGHVMKRKRILVVALLASLLGLGLSVYAQVSRPYRNGSVWSIALIRVKPGMNEAYMKYITGQWKDSQ